MPFSSAVGSADVSTHPALRPVLGLGLAAPLVTLLHIVPRLPPAIDGVGDFAVSLGMKLEEKLNLRSLFLSADELPEKSKDALAERLAALNCDRILLHYSGYGYHPRGVPAWLVDGMQSISESRDLPISVFFHELWVSSVPWKTPFYFALAQRHLVRRLLTLASASYTSAPRMKRLLERFGKSAALAPIPSSIPSIPAGRTSNSNQLTALIFGQEHTRVRSVKAHSVLLRSLANSGRLSGLRLIGKGAHPGSADHASAVSCINPRLVATAADTSPEETGREFAHADIFLSFYPLDFLTKSSTVMAAFACGCPVILPLQNGTEEFSPRPPVVLCGGAKAEIARSLTPENLRQTSREALRWYEQHASWDRLVEKMALA